MNLLRVCLLALVLLVTAAFAVAQSSYSPRRGETVMKVDVEGRGTISILLYTKEAKNTTAHIIKLANSKFYDGQRFHRVITSPRPYLIQMGAPGSRTKSMDDESLLTEGSGTKVAYEDSGFKLDAAGMVGLSAQTGDKDSGDSQFFILLGPSPFLDGNYTVFGKVVAGMDVVKSVKLGDRVTQVTIERG